MKQEATLATTTTAAGCYSKRHDWPTSTETTTTTISAPETETQAKGPGKQVEGLEQQRET